MVASNLLAQSAQPSTLAERYFLRAGEAIAPRVFSRSNARFADKICHESCSSEASDGFLELMARACKTFGRRIPFRAFFFNLGYVDRLGWGANLVYY